MDINYLREFIVLSQTLNFSKASEVLFISQPTLSRHIHIIEEEVGCNLFFRTKHSVELNKFGKEFLREINDIVSQYDNVVKKLSTLKESKTLKIGILYYQKEFFLSKLNLFKNLYPNIELDYFLGTPNDIVDLVLNGEIDIGSSMDVKFLGYDLIDFYQLYNEPLVVMVNNNNDLSSYEEISLEELKNISYVFVDDNFYSGYLRLFKDTCRDYGGFVPKNINFVEDYEKMMLTVQTEPVASIVTTNMKNVGCSNCSFVNIKDNILSIDRCLIYRYDNFNSTIPLFLDLFKK